MSSLKPIKRMCDATKLNRDGFGPSEVESRPAKRRLTFPAATLRSRHHQRRNSEEALHDSSDKLRLYISPIETLPQELLLQVFEHLVHPSLITAGFPESSVAHYSDNSFDDFEADRNGSDMFAAPKAVCRKDLRNVCLVSHQFKLAATTLLYRCAHLATAKSPGDLLLVLKSHPDLQSLVRHISVPAYLGRLTDRFDFAFIQTQNRTFDVDHRLPRKTLEKEFFAKCGEYIEGGLLRLMIPLVPNLRTLVIPQLNLLDGPCTKGLILSNLTTLRMTLTTPSEVMFYMGRFHTAFRTIAWLTPESMGHDFPGLRRLEIHTPTGRWEADLITEEADGRPPLKFVETLTTTTTADMAPAEWNLMSLNQPVFSSSKLHTLIFGGPGEQCKFASTVPFKAGWDLNIFLAKKGGGLQTLSLDLERHDIDDDDVPSNRDLHEVYFGPAGMVRSTSLRGLASLTHLTISLQALFVHADMFGEFVEEMEDSMDDEFTKMLPPSLRTLRIAEYIPGVYESDEWPSDTDGTEADLDQFTLGTICTHCNYVYRFLKALGFCWQLRAEGRELWLRRYAALDILESRTGIDLDPDYSGLMMTLAEKDGDFERIPPPPKDMVWLQW